VKEYLQAVIDPELGVTIVDLGLIYGVEFPTEDTVKIIMTLTSMGCPLFGTIHDEIVSALKPLGYQNSQVEIDLVWDPPWNQSMMSEVAKAELGIE
jgi:metal-sulfur cluster biosynthetic enzyme